MSKFQQLWRRLRRSLQVILNLKYQYQCSNFLKTVYDYIIILQRWNNRKPLFHDRTPLLRVHGIKGMLNFISIFVVKTQDWIETGQKTGKGLIHISIRYDRCFVFLR